MQSLPPLSLYIHLPWCVRKCPYCDFNSHTAASVVPFARYADALIRDIRSAAAMTDGRDLVSVFMGGGTPSLFPAEEINRVLDAVRTNIGIKPQTEVTMEANPGTVDFDDPAGYLQAGVNRLSIGAQSFSDTSLQQLGRIHASNDIRAAVRAAQTAGFDNLNIDLMYGLPGQDAAAALDDIEQAAALQPAHISWYQLTLEPNTVFYARPPAGIPDDDGLFEIQRQGGTRLQELGFEQYEVSAFSRRGRQCRHNLNYWRFGDYLAVGAGAHGKLTRADGVCRQLRPANPLAYMVAVEQGAAAASTPVAANDLLFEFMLNALRLDACVEEALFEARTGRPAAMLRAKIEPLCERGLLEPSGAGRWRKTDLGRRFLNDLQAAFLPD